MVGVEAASTAKAMNFPHPGFKTEEELCHLFLSVNIRGSRRKYLCRLSCGIGALNSQGHALHNLLDSGSTAPRRHERFHAADDPLCQER